MGGVLPIGFDTTRKAGNLLREPDYVVFYWTGRLPDISLLAITSALNKTKDAQVIVFLDADEGFQSSVPNHFNWIREHPRFQFVDFSLSEWVYSAKAKPISMGLSKARRFLVATMNSVKILKNYGQALPKWVIGLIGFWHPIFGWKARAAPGYAIKYEGPQFRGDVFRVLLSGQFPGKGVLYLDLDVYVSKAVSLWDLDSSFSYRGGDSWANTAILFYHQNREKTTRFLLDEFRLGRSPLPWFMFTDANCSVSEIEVRPAAQFDPGWSQSSVSHGDAELFFRKSIASDLFLDEIRNELLAVHWHNQWGVIPDAGSPFQILITEEISKLKVEMQIEQKLDE